MDVQALRRICKDGVPVDVKPPARVQDPELLKQLHIEWQECVICHGTAYSEGQLSLHHIHRHPRDDVRANLVMLCGHGTVGCHGLIEAHHRDTCRTLSIYLIRNRLDTMEYLGEKLGGVTAVAEWLRSQLYAPV